MTMMTAIRSAESEAAKGAGDKLAEARRLLPADDGLAAFFDALYAGAVPDDILRARPDQLAALALAVWAEAAKRAPGASHVAALELGHETVLVSINDDRPFLFDSALAAAIAGGARLRAAFHPILDIGGRHTSVIALVCDSLAPQAREDLLSSLRETFAQGAAAVRDWKPMLARLAAARGDLDRHPPRLAGRETDISEDLAFLDWLADNHFTFLGARDYVLAKDGANGILEPVKGSGLGVLADDAMRVVRDARSGERQGLSAEVRAFLDSSDPLIITKSAVRSLVHRRAHMDYIGIKTFGPDGAFVGERRFVGLFTSSTYAAQARSIPLLRRKIEAVMTAAGLDPKEWTPREQRHTFVSVLSDEDMPIEKISDLVGHKDQTTTETVYRHQIRPVVRYGAEAMDPHIP